MRQTVHSKRLSMMLERLNKEIAPNYASVVRDNNGQYIVYLSDDYSNDWICTGTYHEAVVALNALHIAHNYF